MEEPTERPVAEDAPLPPEESAVHSQPAIQPVPEPEPGPKPEAETSTETGALPPASPPETRAGRFARAALRWVLSALVVFALGVAAMYFLRLRPLQTELNAIQTQATQTADRLHTTQQDWMASQEREKLLNGQLEQASAERDLAVGRFTLQKIYTSLAVARLALANKDGALAKSSLEEARADLDALIPLIPTEEAALGESLQGRLDLVLNELNRDPRVALSDLDIFAGTLEELQGKLFE